MVTLGDAGRGTHLGDVALRGAWPLARRHPPTTSRSPFSWGGNRTSAHGVRAASSTWSGLFGGAVSPQTLGKGLSTERRTTSRCPSVGPGSCSPSLKYVPSPRSWPKCTASPEGCTTDRSTTSSPAPEPWPTLRPPGSRLVPAKPRLLPCATSISRGSACLVGRGSPKVGGGLQAAGGLVCMAVTKPRAGVSGRAKLRNRNLIFAQEKAVLTVAAA